MSTRGAIAVPNTDGKGWWGRYHHGDSFPTRLGAELFRLYHSSFDRDLADMARVLITDHRAGWSSIVQAYTPRPFERGAFDHAGFRTPFDTGFFDYPQCYCHGERAQKEHVLICRCPDDLVRCDPLFIEWAYVLTATGMFVATSWHPGTGASQAFVHRLVALVDWDRPEPNWEQVEQRGSLAYVGDLTL